MINTFKKNKNTTAKRLLPLMLATAIFITLLSFGSNAAEPSASPVISNDKLLSFDKTFESSIDYTKKLDSLKNAKAFSVVSRFYQNVDDNMAGSLFSVSNSKERASHFHLYIRGDQLGYEFRINNDTSYSAYVGILRSNGVNSVAFVADPADNTFKLYANGQLVHTRRFDDKLPVFSDIAGLDSVRIGATDRSENNYEYPFWGEMTDIKVYTEALDEEYCKSYTSWAPPTAEALNFDQPFSYGDGFGIATFRIPCLITLQNGDVLAAADLRSHLNDSPNNIELGVRILDKKTNKWGDPIIAMEFDDWEYNVSNRDSASFIDAALVQDNNGRVFMLTDAMPSCAGGGVGGGYNGTVKIGEKYYYALTTGDPVATTGYDYYLYPNPASEHDYDKYIIRKVADSSDTEYTTDGQFYIYKNGEALTVKQQPNNTVDVPMNVFYTRSIFKLYRTSYFWLNYSDDNGLTWSDPLLVGSEYRAVGETFFNKSPGRGTVVQNGKYAGRIIFPIYSGRNSSTDLCVRMLYSDDGGKTWLMGERTTLNKGVDKNGFSLDPRFVSEAQLVEFPDGTLRVFARTGSKYVAYADSIDGGVTFEPMRNDPALDYCSNCMVSAINYYQKIDGKDVIIVSYPGSPNGRADGIIKIGLVNENEGFDTPAYGRYSIEWKYTYEVNKGQFWYSCLTELPDYGLAILYEPGPLVYEELDIKKDIISPNEENALSFTLKDISDTPSQLKVSLSLSETLFLPFCELEDSALTAKDKNGSTVSLTFKEISDDGLTLTYEAKLQDYEKGYSYEVSFAEDNDLVSLSGPIAPAAIAPLKIEYYPEITDTEPDTSDTSDTSELPDTSVADTSEPDVKDTDKESSSDTEASKDTVTSASEDNNKGSIIPLIAIGAVVIIGGAVIFAVQIKKKK